jgi:hypothetical protein
MDAESPRLYDADEASINQMLKELLLYRGLAATARLPP